MSLHSLLVFVHVISAMALATGTLLSLFSLLALRRAERIDQVRSILSLVALSEPVSGIALVLTPLAGLMMTINTWGWQHGWINVAVGSFVLLLPVGAITGLRRRALANLVGGMSDGPLPASVEQRIHDPLLGTGVYLMVTLLLGIVFLMTIKPALDGALTAIVVSVILGGIVSLPLWRTRMREATGTTTN